MEAVVTGSKHLDTMEKKYVLSVISKVTNILQGCSISISPSQTGFNLKKWVLIASDTA